MTSTLFPVWERLGFHITQNHYYSPIPDTRRLDHAFFSRPSALTGIDLRDRQQQELLATFAQKFKREYEHFPRTASQQSDGFHLLNGVFEQVDAEILYGFVRHFKPKHIIEIGSGFSTFLSAAALQKNAEEHAPGELMAIEPFPNPSLRRGFPGLTSLMVQEVQQVPISVFSSLQENDILFIDSSHIVRTGSDVQYEYLEILPMLAPGVIVHIHDIFLPDEYPESWIRKERKFFNEQYLLQAFLTYNDRFEVLWAGNSFAKRYPEVLQQAIPSFVPERVNPGSFWIRRVR